jgi:hypothetical protein
MRVKLDDLSPEKQTAVQDFKSDIITVFNELYEDKWNGNQWAAAVRESNYPDAIPFSSRASLDKYTTSHDTSLLMKTIGAKERTPEEFWSAREAGSCYSFLRFRWLTPTGRVPKRTSGVRPVRTSDSIIIIFVLNQTL